MANILLKKSYLLEDLKEIKFRDLWNSHGVFTTMWIFGKPAKILFFKQHIKNLNPECTYKFINFVQGKEIIKNEFKDETMKDKILYCLDHYPRYCHKSDLLRYCLLYIYGGVYLDVDLKPLISFNDIVTKDIDLFTSFGRDNKPMIINNNLIHPITSNGILISKKENPILLDLIKHSITNKP